MHWTPFSLILEPHEWLWRVTWHHGKAYGASYSRSDPDDKSKEWNIKLFESSNGIDYTLLTQWDIPGFPNETTLRFTKTGEMIALVRRDKSDDNTAWLGYSEAPYTMWHWRATRHYVGGPNFIILPDETMWTAGRLMLNSPYVSHEKTFVGIVEIDDVRPLVLLPGFGDGSYPGIVYHEGILWISYYSTHEANSAIYLARLAI